MNRTCLTNHSRFSMEPIRDGNDNDVTTGVAVARRLGKSRGLCRYVSNVPPYSSAQHLSGQAPLRAGYRLGTGVCCRQAGTTPSERFRGLKGLALQERYGTRPLQRLEPGERLLCQKRQLGEGKAMEIPRGKETEEQRCSQPGSMNQERPLQNRRHLGWRQAALHSCHDDCDDGTSVIRKVGYIRGSRKASKKLIKSPICPI